MLSLGHCSGISQFVYDCCCFVKLSSKRDKRLFCIKFEIPNKGSYPFFEAVTNQIRCISSGRDSVTPERSNQINHHLDGVPEVASSNGTSDILQPSAKRIRLDEERISEREVIQFL